MPIVKLQVRHNYLKQNFLEIRFDTGAKIRDVKSRITSMTGTPQRYQNLLLRRSEDDLVQLSDNTTLGDYGAQSGMILDVIDTNQYSVTKLIGSTSMDQIQPRLATDQEYFSCKNNVVFQIQEKMKNDEYREAVEDIARRRQQALKDEIDRTSAMNIGDTKYYLGLQATIKFIGKVPEVGPGLYVGIESPELQDGGNGYAGATQYFNCQGGKGAFVKPCELDDNGGAEGDVDEL